MIGEAVRERGLHLMSTLFQVFFDTFPSVSVSDPVKLAFWVQSSTCPQILCQKLFAATDAWLADGLKLFKTPPDWEITVLIYLSENYIRNSGSIMFW